MESHCQSAPPTMRGPIKSVWGLKVSPFRYQGLRKINFIPNPSTLQASHVEIKQGLGGRGTLRNLHGADSCHPPGPDDMCHYLFPTWYPKTETTDLISCGFRCWVATAQKIDRIRAVRSGSTACVVSGETWWQEGRPRGVSRDLPLLSHSAGARAKDDGHFLTLF